MSCCGNLLRVHFLTSTILQILICSILCFKVGTVFAGEDDLQAEKSRETIKAIYIPLADHYAGIVAYEKYRDQMIHADYQIEQMKSWPLLRSYFMSGQVDMAYIISPQAMDMFAEAQSFRWVSLMHRDGNAMAINELLNEQVKLPESRHDRFPDESLIEAIKEWHARTGKPVECAVPSLYATHTVVLYKYLRDHGLTLDLDNGKNAHVRAIAVAPPKSPAFIKKRSVLAMPATFEQSLPWAEVVETQSYGHVAWYSRDVMPWENGHVECIAIASDQAIAEKNDALREVVFTSTKQGLILNRLGVVRQ